MFHKCAKVIFISIKTAFIKNVFCTVHLYIFVQMSFRFKLHFLFNTSQKQLYAPQHSSPFLFILHCGGRCVSQHHRGTVVHKTSSSFSLARFRFAAISHVLAMTHPPPYCTIDFSGQCLWNHCPKASLSKHYLLYMFYKYNAQQVTYHVIASIFQC